MNIPPQFAAPILLAISNLFMNLAWYGHLKHRGTALWLVVLTSWGIAFFEYCLAVPANRLGSRVYSPAQLKGMQEFLSITTFVLFSATYLGQMPTPRQLLGFALMIFAAYLVVGERG